MIITGKRIRNLTRQMVTIPNGAAIIIGLTDIQRFATQIRQIGFQVNPNDGETILPPGSFGPVSFYNAAGKELVNRDQPMETAYRQAEWCWKEWHGSRDKVERSRIVDIPYKRYPRTFVPPPSVEMTITTDQMGNRLLITDNIHYVRANHSRILHTINLFLEVFGECNVLDQKLQVIHHPNIRRVNWKVLPQGRMPWNQLHTELRPVLEREAKGNQPVIKYRFQAVNAHHPEFVAIGQGGFNGYVIFAFPDQHLFILECVHFGNATYVFGDDWETLSQMTKAEILNEDLQQDRLIHRIGWKNRLNELFA